jgi:hypothetical protein
MIVPYLEMTLAVADDDDLGELDTAIDNCTNVSIFKKKALLIDIASGPKWQISGNKEGATITTNLVGKFVGRARNARTLGFNTIEMVEENESTYTTSEREAAKKMIEFIRKPGFKSPVNLADMGKLGSFIGDVPTAHDFKRAIDIYGKPLAYFQGKMKNTKAPAIKTEYVAPITRKNQKAHVDITNFEGMNALVAKAEPLGLSICVAISSHGHKGMCRAIQGSGSPCCRVLLSKSCPRDRTCHELRG